MGLIVIMMFYSLANAILGTHFFNISISSAKVSEDDAVEIVDADFLSEDELPDDFLEDDFMGISRNVGV